MNNKDEFIDKFLKKLKSDRFKNDPRHQFFIDKNFIRFIGNQNTSSKPSNIPETHSAHFKGLSDLQKSCASSSSNTIPSDQESCLAGRHSVPSKMTKSFSHNHFNDSLRSKSRSRSPIR
uniref:Uncharacterized protein n=1 Tax=Panagrolaimus davidi TaxID=227884 RepID=A0A914PEH2_9BILA